MRELAPFLLPPCGGDGAERARGGCHHKPNLTSPTDAFGVVSPVKGEKKSSGNDHRALYLNQPTHVVQSVGEGAFDGDGFAAFKVFDCALR
jgi:hypothetical protein